MLVLVTNVVQNGIADNYDSITDGLLLVVIVILWSYAIDWLSLHFRPLRWFAYPRPIKIIENGKPLWETIQRELFTEEQLYSLLRQQGVEDVSEVKEASIEPNGLVSVIPFGNQQGEGGGAQSFDIAT